MGRNLFDSANMFGGILLNVKQHERLQGIKYQLEKNTIPDFKKSRNLPENRERELSLRAPCGKILPQLGGRKLFKWTYGFCIRPYNINGIVMGLIVSLLQIHMLKC